MKGVGDEWKICSLLIGINRQCAAKSSNDGGCISAKRVLSLFGEELSLFDITFVTLFCHSERCRSSVSRGPSSSLANSSIWEDACSGPSLGEFHLATIASERGALCSCTLVSTPVTNHDNHSSAWFFHYCLMNDFEIKLWKVWEQLSHSAECFCKIVFPT